MCTSCCVSSLVRNLMNSSAVAFFCEELEIARFIPPSALGPGSCTTLKRPRTADSRVEKFVRIGPIPHEDGLALLELLPGPLLVVAERRTWDPTLLNTVDQESEPVDRLGSVCDRSAVVHELAALPPDRFGDVHSQPLVMGELPDVAVHPLTPVGVVDQPGEV